MKRHIAIASLLACSLSFGWSAAQAATLTNADIVKLLDAGMPESVILDSIAGNASKFDTSPDALIKLKKKGASAAVLQAVMNPKSVQAGGGAAAPAAQSSTQTSAASARASATLNPEEVQVLVNGQESPMQYIIPEMRTAARAFGFGGVASYAALHGSKAARRLPSEGLEFIISVPKNAQAVSYLTLANFAVRNNGTREVSTGGGYMSYSTGIAKDRVISVKSEALSDQSRARDGFVLYRVTPERALAAGEYAVVLYTQEIRTAGFFAQTGNSYFDFGVD